MLKVSIAFPISYGDSSPYQKYMPLIIQLKNDDILEKCYGIGFSRKFRITNEPVEKMVLTKIPTRLSRFVIRLFCKIFKLPLYYVYWSKIKIFDFLFSERIARDNSNIVLTTPLLVRTIEKAKNSGKTVIVEAGNSEPQRENRRIINEYKKYGIKNQFIYGNSIYKDTCIKSLDLSDYIVCISKVSMDTYKEAGYDMTKIRLISMAGTDFHIYDVRNLNAQPAFISTAFHSFIKGTHILLGAWKKAEITNIPLLIVGDLCEDMQEFVKRFGPFPNVYFIGTKKDLQAWYKEYAAVGILLSLSEGAVRVTPEMMAFGFPMIVSIDATCDLVEDEINGFVIDVNDEQKLIKKMKWFAEDWSRVYSMKKQVLNSVKTRKMQDYSLDLYAFVKEIANQK